MRDCHDNLIRIFHLEREVDGKVERSTLQIARRWISSTQWRIDQHYGFFNAPLPPASSLAGKKVLARFQTSARAKSKAESQSV